MDNNTLGKWIIRHRSFPGQSLAVKVSKEADTFIGEKIKI